MNSWDQNAYAQSMLNQQLGAVSPLTGESYADLSAQITALRGGQQARRRLPLWALAVIGGVAQVLALVGAAPSPSPSPVASEAPIRATVACSVLVEHARLKEPPKVMTPELFGSLEAAALRIHGVTFEPGSGVTKRQLLEAEADVLGCLGL